MAPETDPFDEAFPGRVASRGLDVNVFAEPRTDSDIVDSVADGEAVLISCTARGEVVEFPEAGATSDLWDYTGQGYVPDVFIDTGTNEPVRPSCPD
jgi:LasA protease